MAIHCEKVVKKICDKNLKSLATAASIPLPKSASINLLTITIYRKKPTTRKSH